HPPLPSWPTPRSSDLPGTAWFSVPLTVDVEEVRMCGEGLRAPCSRIEGLGTAGSVLLRVDWTEGATNGRSDWHIGELQSERVEQDRKSTRLNSSHVKI